MLAGHSGYSSATGEPNKVELLRVLPASVDDICRVDAPLYFLAGPVRIDIGLDYSIRFGQRSS